MQKKYLKECEKTVCSISTVKKNIIHVMYIKYQFGYDGWGGIVKDSEIHIGDVLRIKEWDDMVREFGTDANGYINTRYGFRPDIKYLCGKQFCVTKILDGVFGKLYEGIILDLSKTADEYFAPDELEPLSDEEWDVADDEEMKLLFC